MLTINDNDVEQAIDRLELAMKAIWWRGWRWGFIAAAVSLFLGLVAGAVTRAAEIALTPEEIAAIAAEVPPGSEGPAGPPGSPGANAAAVSEAAGVCSVAVGGSVFVWACVESGTTPPPIEPPPTGEEPQVTFGPNSGIVEYPAVISALKQDAQP